MGSVVFGVGKSLNIGISEIDDAHAELDELVKSIEYSLVANAPIEEIHRYLLMFISATKEHFKNEERLLSSFNLPSMAAHKAEHKRLVRLLLEVESNISEVNGDWRKTLMSLTDVLTRHIIVFDFEAKTRAGVKH